MLRFSDDKAVVNERMPWHMRSGFVDPWVAVSIYRDYKAVRVAFVQCVIGTQRPLEGINGIPGLERCRGRKYCFEWYIFGAHQRCDTTVWLKGSQEIEHLPKISYEACKTYLYGRSHTSMPRLSSIVRS